MISISPASTSFFRATQTEKGIDSYEPSTRDAYAVFHEVVPAADLGNQAVTRLTVEQRAFVRRVLPGLVQVSRTAGDTDAVAETLVAAALLGEQESAAPRQVIVRTRLTVNPVVAGSLS